MTTQGYSLLWERLLAQTCRTWSMSLPATSPANAVPLSNVSIEVGDGIGTTAKVSHAQTNRTGGLSTVADPSQLCGACGRGKVAVSPDGDVWPCVFSRWMPVGNVRRESLAEIVNGSEMASATAALQPQLERLPSMAKPCDPVCGPNCGPACNPSCWPTGAGPCGPKGGCQPNYD